MEKDKSRDPHKRLMKGRGTQRNISRKLTKIRWRGRFNQMHEKTEVA